MLFLRRRLMAQAYIDNRLASFKLAYQRYGLEARAIWALKFAFLACLPGEIIQTDSDSNGILTPPFIMMSFIVVTTAGTFGRGFANFLVGLKIVLCRMRNCWHTQRRLHP
ncbi:transmembrane protein, putative, partial [Bodo saltans]